jgi:succinoglycan biosynthesis transport protein ExoP
LADIHLSSAASAEVGSGPKLSDYLLIARRRKWWIILGTMGFFLSTTVLVSRLPNIYRAETVILVDSAEVPDKYVATIVTTDIASRLTTLQQQVLSPTRLKKLVEEEGLYPDAVAKRTEEDVIHSLQKSILIEVVSPGGGKMGAFRIQYSGRRRTEVARVTNKLAQMFIDKNLQAREEQTQGTAEFLESQLQETKRQLDEKDAQLRAIKSSNILDLPESKPYHMEALANLRAQSQAIKDKIIQDQREKSMLESLMTSGGDATPTVEAAKDGSDEKVASPYQSQIQKLESKLAELRTRYGPGHPDVRKIQGELARAKAKTADGAGTTTTSAVALEPAIQATPTHRNPVLQAQMEQVDEEIKQQTKLLQPIQEQIDFHTSKLQQVPVFEQQISRLQQDYDILRVQYTQLLGQEKSAEISHALEVHQKGEHFTVLDAAVTPDKPAAPNRMLLSFAGLIGGALVSIALAVTVDMHDESVRSEAEAAQLLGKPVLSGIPQIVSVRERRARRLRAVGMLVGTAVVSSAFGLLLSVMFGGLF